MLLADDKLYILFSVQPVEEYDDSGLAELYSNGDVIWVNTARRRAPCVYIQEEATWNCSMWWASWSYSANSLTPQFYDRLEAMYVDDYAAINDYEIVSNTATIRVKKYACCPEEFPDMSFHLKMRRKDGESSGVGINYVNRSLLYTAAVVVACLSIK